jgi:hypothetical protein
MAPTDVVQYMRSFVEPGVLPRGLRAEDGRDPGDAPGTAAYLEALRYENTPKGLPAARMTASQRQVLEAVIRQYGNRLPEELAEQQLARVTGSVLEQMHFAWAGPARRGQPHYYRIQGPRLLIEYDNTQNDSNHIHAVWRDPEGDFGADVLAMHYHHAH